ncbi:hypothetical protein Dimus_010225 [Dionaea muscipula]
MKLDGSVLDVSDKGLGVEVPVDPNLDLGEKLKLEVPPVATQLWGDADEEVRGTDFESHASVAWDIVGGDVSDAILKFFATSAM